MSYVTPAGTVTLVKFTVPVRILRVVMLEEIVLWAVSTMRSFGLAPLPAVASKMKDSVSLEVTPLVFTVRLRES